MRPPPAALYGGVRGRDAVEPTCDSVNVFKRKARSGWASAADDDAKTAQSFRGFQHGIATQSAKQRLAINRRLHGLRDA